MITQVGVHLRRNCHEIRANQMLKLSKNGNICCLFSYMERNRICCPVDIFCDFDGSTKSNCKISHKCMFDQGSTFKRFIHFQLNLVFQKMGSRSRHDSCSEIQRANAWQTSFRLAWMQFSPDSTTWASDYELQTPPKTKVRKKFSRSDNVVNDLLQIVIKHTFWNCHSICRILSAIKIAPVFVP